MTRMISKMQNYFHCYVQLPFRICLVQLCFFFKTNLISNALIGISFDRTNDVTHNLTFLKAQIRGKKMCSQDKKLLNLVVMFTLTTSRIFAFFLTRQAQGVLLDRVPHHSNFVANAFFFFSCCVFKVASRSRQVLVKGKENFHLHKV
jgi:hypothetical protein